MKIKFYISSEELNSFTSELNQILAELNISLQP